MTLASILWLSLGTWGQRLLGMFLGGRLLERLPAIRRIATLIPAAVVMAVILQLTFTTAGDLALDGRAVGMGVAAVLVWRRAPFLLIVLAAATSTALVRLMF